MAQAQHLLGRVYMNQKMCQKAWDCFRRTLELDHTAAERAFRTALELVPEDDYALLHLAKTLAACQRAAEARSRLLKVMAKGESAVYEAASDLAEQL
jgi:Tfp pilus assembly protein PilF